MECWALLRWTDSGAVSVLGVYTSYEAARRAKGDSLDPRRVLLKTELHMTGAHYNPASAA